MFRSARGKSGSVGIEGVLRNDKGDIQGMFSKGAGIKVSNQQTIVTMMILGGCLVGVKMVGA